MFRGVETMENKKKKLTFYLAVLLYLFEAISKSEGIAPTLWHLNSEFFIERVMKVGGLGGMGWVCEGVGGGGVHFLFWKFTLQNYRK